MKNIYLIGLLTLAACDAVGPDGADAAPADARGGQPRVGICHYDTDAGTFALVTVAAPAVPAHVAHGDGAPGGAVPNQAGYTFDEACVPVEAGDHSPPTCTVRLASGPPQNATIEVEDDGSGLAEILVTLSSNADTIVPPFIVGTVDPVTVSSTQIGASSTSGIETRVTDLAGNVRICDVTIPPA